jgi:hypothetical protein
VHRERATGERATGDRATGDHTIPLRLPLPLHTRDTETTDLEVKRVRRERGTRRGRDAKRARCERRASEARAGRE